MENNRIDLCAPEGETPIYDQIRQELAGRIRAGSLPDGTRLPTVRELSEQLHVAEGTVKRAYDELERDGLLIKTPGRGSFVCYHRTADRRQAAQEQIDALLQQLHQMGISVHEMKQLFADQLRRFCAQQPKLQVALVECNPEVLAQLKEQLRHMDGIELHTLLLEQVQQHPGRLAQQMDVMITTTEHAKQLAGMTGQAEKVAKIALRLQASSVAPIVKLSPGQRVGIVSQSLRFGDLRLPLGAARLGLGLAGFGSGLLLSGDGRFIVQSIQIVVGIPRRRIVARRTAGQSCRQDKGSN